MYEGQWEHDLQNGLGMEKWADGSTFQGTYKNGLKNGPGHYQWADGSEYNGEWLDNQIEG